MKTLTFTIISKDEYANLRKADKALAETFYEEITQGSTSSFYVKYPLSVAGWYIEDNKAGKAFVKQWTPAIEDAQKPKDDPKTEIIPKSKKAAQSDTAALADLIANYNELTKLSKKSAIQKKMITAIEEKIEAM